MNSRKLQNRLYMGLGISARHLGNTTDAFRPAGASKPLDMANRFLRLQAAFVSPNGSHPNVYGDPIWNGIFDAHYTKSGDYLVQESGTYFVASQKSLQPILCVMTNRTISIGRPTMQTLPASNSYGGYSAGSSRVLLSDWPASVLATSRSGSTGANLPTDQAVPYLTVLLPATYNLELVPGDLITDDLNRSAVIQAAELSDLGWRLTAKMATP